MKQQTATYKKQQRKRGKIADKKHARIQSFKRKRKLATIAINKQIESIEKKHIKQLYRDAKKQRLHQLLNDDNASENHEILSQSHQVLVHEIDLTPIDLKQPQVKLQKHQEENLNKKEYDSSKSVDDYHCVKSLSGDENNYLLYVGQDDAIAALETNQQLFKFHGYGKITILIGKCSVNGFQMKPGDTQAFYAPISHSAMVIKPIDTLVDQSKISSILKTKRIEAAVSKELKNIQKVDAVVLFESLEESEAPRSLPGFAHVYNIDSSNVLSKRRLCRTLWQCETEKYRYFNEHSYYHNVLSAVLSYKQPQSTNDGLGFCHQYSVTVTVGGKNVGKSTLNRYLVNRLLERHPFVYYFECDVGQTEFTPPGFVSIHKVDRKNPLLGPPFTHQRPSKYLCYFGDKTPEGDPDRYIECIDYLFAELQRDIRGGLVAPVVVNTNGWVRSLGSRLLLDIIRTVSPTHVLQFESADLSLNHKGDLNWSFLSKSDGWITKKENQLRSFEFIKLKTDYTFKEGKKYKAQNLRCLSLLSYINQMVKICQSQQKLNLRGASLLNDLQAINPFCVHLPRVVLCNALDKPVIHKYAAAALNTSIVGLCCLPDEIAAAMKNPPDDVCLYRPPVCRCLGLGIVRGVDPENKLAYVISDLPLSEIEKVNCLIRGDTSLPDALLTDRESNYQGDRPYTSYRFGPDVVGSSSVRARNSLCR